MAALTGGFWQSWGSPSERSLPGGFSDWLFQPCLLHCSPSGPSLHTAWTPSLCLAQTTSWVAGQHLRSSMTGASTAVANRSPRLGAGPGPGRFPVWPSPPGVDVELHPSGTHILLLYPAPSQKHEIWDHQVISVAQQSQTALERVLSPPGKGTASPAMCLLPGPALLSSWRCHSRAADAQGWCPCLQVLSEPLLQSQGQAEGQSRKIPLIWVHTTRSQAGTPTAIALHRQARLVGNGGNPAPLAHLAGAQLPAESALQHQ